MFDKTGRFIQPKKINSIKPDREGKSAQRDIKGVGSIILWYLEIFYATLLCWVNPKQAAN